jgi:uncharacterized protein (UPF0332 family)
MAQYAPPSTLIRVSKASKREATQWDEGVWLTDSTGRTIEALRHRAVADRLALARSFRRQAERMLATTPPFYRDAVSRFYYSMYHAMRAVVFFIERGDDFEAHSKLPGKTPKDFPRADLWRNALKDARLTRNAADYDPYPKSDSAYRKIAHELQRHSAELVRESHSYLRSKGCSHL